MVSADHPSLVGYSELLHGGYKYQDERRKSANWGPPHASATQQAPLPRHQVTDARQPQGNQRPPPCWATEDRLRQQRNKLDQSLREAQGEAISKGKQLDKAREEAISKDEKIKNLLEELEQARQEIASTKSELQKSQETLQKTNEDLRRAVDDKRRAEDEERRIRRGLQDLLSRRNPGSRMPAARDARHQQRHVPERRRERDTP